MKNLGWLNKALLSKWCWRFATKRGTLWNEVIRGKYREQEGGWRFGLGSWKAILCCWPCVSSNLSFDVCNGQIIKFWKDAWMENTLLQVAFLLLFALIDSKEAWVREYWSNDSSVGDVWTPIFTRIFND